MYQVVEVAVLRGVGTVENLDIHLEASLLVFRSQEEVDRLFRGNQKDSHFLLGKGSCLQRGKEKGKGHGSRGEKENEDLDHLLLHLGRGQGQKAQRRLLLVQQEKVVI